LRTGAAGLRAVVDQAAGYAQADALFLSRSSEISSPCFVYPKIRSEPRSFGASKSQQDCYWWCLPARGKTWSHAWS